MNITPKAWFLFTAISGSILFLSVLLAVLHRAKVYELVENKTAIDGKIRRINTEHGLSFIELTSGWKIRIVKSSNYGYPLPGLSENAKTNDSIHKKANSDTLYLFKHKKNEVYLFVIGDVINLSHIKRN